MKPNPTKSQVVHVRNHQRPRCDLDLYIDLREMAYVSEYKYLGCWISEFLNHSRTVDALTSAVGRSFGRIVNIFKRMGDMGYETYSTLCDSYVLPVANYMAGVWGFDAFPAPQVLQNRMDRFFLGVHRFTPLPAAWSEMDWMSMRRMRWLEIIRLYNRISVMSEFRLPRKVLDWDIKCGVDGWVNDFVNVCKTTNIPVPTRLNLIYDLEPIRRKMELQCRDEWRDAAGRMSKLRTYVKIKDFTEIGTLVKANLPRSTRSLVSRFLCGILPLEVETGRYNRTKKELRFCKLCEKQEVEDELHFLFRCKRLEPVREVTLDTFLSSNAERKTMTEYEKNQWMLDKARIKEFADVLTQMFQARQNTMSK